MTAPLCADSACPRLGDHPRYDDVGDMWSWQSEAMAIDETERNAADALLAKHFPSLYEQDGDVPTSLCGRCGKWHWGDCGCPTCGRTTPRYCSDAFHLACVRCGQQLSEGEVAPLCADCEMGAA